MEIQRILDVYKERDSRHRAGFFTYEDLAQLLRTYERYRKTLLLLKRYKCHPLSDLRILDVGCGDGTMLRQFLQWGAKPENLAGIELRSEPVHHALHLNPNLDVRCASAAELSWPSNSFDLVCQHTVFSSILDVEMKENIASEMIRVLKNTGLILWYDFWLNPMNPQTHGIRPGEIKHLFPDCTFDFQRVTLAPPIARRLVPVSWLFCAFLERLKIFNTHYLVAITKVSSNDGVCN